MAREKFKKLMEIVPISLDIKLDIVENRDSLVKKLEQEDRLSLLANFEGYFDFYLDNKNIFAGKDGKSYLTEPLIWLYWLMAEKNEYSNPQTYVSDAPKKYLEIERAKKSHTETKKIQDLNKWASGHVLANYLGAAPYITFQSPDREILEITWNFGEKPYFVIKRGEANVSLSDFLDQVNTLGITYRKKLESEFPVLKEKNFFKQFLSYLG